MNPESIRIVYMGTPGFAVKPLQKLIHEGYLVAGVVTAPDRPAGRGKKLRESEVKTFIREQHPRIPLLQPQNLKDPEFLEELQSLQPDLQAVVAFRMLPEAVWKIPPLGTFNLHASLLPQYRGAAPINHVLMNGERETGVTTFLIDHQIDTGNILLREPVQVGDQETAGELHDRLMEKGSELLVKTVRGLAEGTLKALPQDRFIQPEETLKTAPKISKEDCRIDWHQKGRVTVNQIRGLSPVPGAFTFLETTGSGTEATRGREVAEKPGSGTTGSGNGMLCKVFRASFEPATPPEKPGTLLSDGRKTLQVAVPDGFVHVHSLQMEGKRRMETEQFLAGFRITSGNFRFS